MVQGKVEICGVNTATLPILKESEKEALFARIKQGDKKARETYIKGNLRLVLSVIKRFSITTKTWMTCFRLAVLVSSNPLTTLTRRWGSNSQPMPFQ